MVLIKILSIFLLLPSLFVLNKLVKKKDLNFFDLLIVFNTLYFVIIPLKSNKSVFDSIGRITESTSILVFFYLLFFFISLLIASRFVGMEVNSPINLTYYIKNYPKLKGSLFFKVFLIVLPIFSIIYYVPQISMISAFDEIQDASSNISYEQSSLIKFFATIFKIGLVVVITMFIQNIKEKKYDILIIISLLLFLINLLLLSRRELLLFFLFGAIIFYSYNRDLINRKLMLFAVVLGVFLYFIYFPFYNIIRFSPVEFNIKNPTSSIAAIYDYGIDSFGDAKESASERTDSRALGLYRAIYWLTEYDTDSDITWGGITLSAIDHAIPKVINPKKGLGSELILQDRMHTAYDSADSVLLLALADYSMLGAVFTALIYFLVYKIMFFISRSSEFFFGKTIISLYLVFFLFSLAFDTEQKLDGMLANMVAYILVIVLIVLVHRLNFIRMAQIEE
tara:strand:+ start:4144 stop:5496 length:1353 start_codon:yes stop_codon:yes gene_type:complete